jgi:hypothetical protein
MYSKQKTKILLLLFCFVSKLVWNLILIILNHVVGAGSEIQKRISNDL